MKESIGLVLVAIASFWLGDRWGYDHAPVAVVHDGESDTQTKMRAVAAYHAGYNDCRRAVGK